MNVAELIEHLRKFPDNLPVLVEGYETGWDGIHELCTAGVVLYRKAEELDGEYQLPAEVNQAGHPGFLIAEERDDEDQPADEVNQAGQPAVLLVGRRVLAPTEN